MLRSVTAIADKLGLEFALFHRKRVGKSQDAPEQMELLVGDVRGKVCSRPASVLWLSVILTGLVQVAILVDDMIDTGTTLGLAARSLNENGATRTYALVSHGTSPSHLPLIFGGFTSSRTFLRGEHECYR
jgi:ribose-phosphate pyrophosphokinase